MWYLLTIATPQGPLEIGVWGGVSPSEYEEVLDRHGVNPDGTVRAVKRAEMLGWPVAE